MVSKFKETSEGVHLMFGEFTLCGDAIDIHVIEPDAEPLRDTLKTEISCPRCAAVVRACRFVKIDRETP